jgi:hypothetical protein
VSLPLKGGSTTPPMGRKSIVQTNPANTLLDNPTDEGIATAMMNGGTAPTNVGSSSASNSVGGSSNGASNAGNGGASGADGANGNAADNNDRPPTQSGTFLEIITQIKKKRKIGSGFCLATCGFGHFFLNHNSRSFSAFFAFINLFFRS